MLVKIGDTYLINPDQIRYSTIGTRDSFYLVTIHWTDGTNDSLFLGSSDDAEEFMRKLDYTTNW